MNKTIPQLNPYNHGVKHITKVTKRDIKKATCVNIVTLQTEYAKPR